MAESLPAFPTFDPSPELGDVATRWRKWVNRFTNLMTALDIGEDIRLKALLLHYVGETTHDIFNTLIVGSEDESEFTKGRRCAYWPFRSPAKRWIRNFSFPPDKAAWGRGHHLVCDKVTTACGHMQLLGQWQRNQVTSGARMHLQPPAPENIDQPEPDFGPGDRARQGQWTCRNTCVNNWKRRQYNE